MTVWDTLVGQRHVVEVLRAASLGRGMTHAWLLTGPPGSGRSNAAVAFAAALQCGNGGCGECHTCRTVMAGAHPDVRVHRPQRAQILVAEAREWVAKAALMPATGRLQVTVVEDADRLNDSSGNALLKAIEEPSPRTVWVLCAPQPEDVLQTIRSRVRHVSLATPTAAEVADFLVRRHDVPPEMAAHAARASQGHIGRAKALALEEDTRRRRREVVTLPARLRTLGDCLVAAANVLDIATSEATSRTEQLAVRETADLEALYGTDRRGKGMQSARAAYADLAGQQKARQRRQVLDAVDRSLTELLSVYRDVLVLQTSAGAVLVNEEQRRDVEELARRTTPETTARRLRRVVLALALLLVAAQLAGCSLLDRGPSLTAAPLTGAGKARPPDPALARFYEQRLDWSDCRDGMRCAELTVPLDYDRPGGRTIRLSVLEAPATDADQRVGALMVNPGGPGVSAVEYAAAADRFFGPEVRAAFDIVGMDPRGVGRSTPVDCVSDGRLDAMLAADPDPDTPAEAAAGRRMVRALGEGCLRRSGDLARHMSTEEAARDMDVLRGALGQERMAYFGASYGTLLGATYADLFPSRVGRMVLDGAVDPSLGTVDISLAQARGFETALRAYVGHCVDSGDCVLGADVEAGMKRVRDLLQSLDAHPLPAAGPRELTEGLAAMGIWLPLYNRASWPALDKALEQALRGDGTLLLSFADQYADRGPQGYVDNFNEAIYAVMCLDSDEVVTPRDLQRLEPRFEAASPTFGRMLAYGTTACSRWPVRSGGSPHELHAPGAAPIVVIGTSRDPATPEEWARSLAAQLDSGVLVTRDGDGHTGYRSGNACVDDAVEGYLVSGVVPKDGLAC